ncbi:hypothetical protein Ancab_020746 [Ancistrocladus abbreviatus]
MSTFTNLPAIIPATKNTTTPNCNHHKLLPLPTVRASLSENQETDLNNKRRVVSALVTASIAAALGLNGAPAAFAEKWGTRSFLWEHFFEPELSPEDAADRIRQTADGLHSLRHMLDTMSWRYVIFYIRLKSAYLKQDMKAALSTVPIGRRKSYVDTANELIDNMAEYVQGVHIHYQTTKLPPNCSTKRNIVETPQIEDLIQV